MNEVRVEGIFYMQTTVTTNDDALREFRDKCEQVGINADNIFNVIIRDEDGNDLTKMQEC